MIILESAFMRYGQALFRGMAGAPRVYSQAQNSFSSRIGVLPSQLPKRPPVSVKIVPYEESLRLSERNFDRLLEGIFAESHQ